ncbi:ion channel TACAN-like isoform X3 [Carcharodon carcharias]|uniref:ion channel TACAN-like isoform X3 n=1 Tax=Carcharodon carcharias TaxID=13397 RepID=UPI001B7F6E97|nr:ion channel TACAN-like isoform X3 [Carcharodon carcharias]
MSFQEYWEEWEGLDKDYQLLQETHKLYKQQLEEVIKLQNSCLSSIERQKKKYKELSKNLERCQLPETEEQLRDTGFIQELMKERQNIFFEMEAFLPKKNGLYLSLVLGNVNVTLLSKQAKFAYKDEYEKFKLYLTIILLVISFTCRFLLNSRVVDSVFNFLLVWYYCTLTIRESILINNGSRIKGWWVMHHYVSAFLSGVMLTWPDSKVYQIFRNQFLSFSMYQKGFQSWMWRGLTFLLPFLFFGHFWQLYNAITLFKLTNHPDCKEWQVSTCGLAFLVLFLGNFLTTVRVIYQKQKQREEKVNKQL